MTTPSDRKYTKTHEWAKLPATGGVNASLGITEYNVSQRGQVTAVTGLLKSGTIAQGDVIGQISGTVSNTAFHAPLGGNITDRNEILEDSVDSLNTDPYSDNSWFNHINNYSNSEYDGLMTAQQYDDYLQTL